MPLIFDPDFLTFAKQALPYLSKKEGLNNLILGVIGNHLTQKREASRALLMRFIEKRKIQTVAVQAGGHNLVLTKASSRHLLALAQGLLEKKAQLPGVVGPPQEAKFFAEVWQELSGKKASLAMAQKVFELKKIIWPAPIKGQMERASLKESKIVAKLVHAFAQEALPKEAAFKSFKLAHDYVKKRIEAGEIFLWKEKKVVKAMTAFNGPTPQGIRIGLVYTLPKYRGLGVAANLVAQQSDYAFQVLKVKYCFLFTDEKNPISNGVYQRLGYKCIGQSVHYVFS